MVSDALFIQRLVNSILTQEGVEIIDFGFPQNSEIDTLKMYITTESIKSEMAVVCPFWTLLPLIL